MWDVNFSISNLILQYIESNTPVNISQIIYRNIKFYIQIYMKFNNISNSVVTFFALRPWTNRTVWLNCLYSFKITILYTKYHWKFGRYLPINLVTFSGWLMTLISYNGTKRSYKMGRKWNFLNSYFNLFFLVQLYKFH